MPVTRHVAVVQHEGCDVATPPEPVEGRPGRYVCSACGTEFTAPSLPTTELRAEIVDERNTMKRLLIAIALMTASIPTATQTPQEQPLVQASDVVYVGSIYAPVGIGDIGQNGMAVVGSRWFFGCTYGVAELVLPPIGGTASMVTPCTPLPNIDQVHPHDRDVHIGGMLPWKGGLVTTAFVYYDAGWGQRAGHWWSPSGVTGTVGPFAMQTPFTDPPQGRQRMVAGYMGVIPPEWRSLLGGPALTGQCCIPIIGNSSHGPSFSVFDPDDVGVTTPIPSTMLVGYPAEHMTLGEYGPPPTEFYGGTNQLGSVAFPAGTRSILLTGRHGATMCYGPGTADPTLVGTMCVPGNAYQCCYDPYSADQGAHGPPYAPTMWAYDANDALAVKQGTKQYWEVVPYAKWTLPHWSADQPNLMRAGFYDQATKRYYVGHRPTRSKSTSTRSRSEIRRLHPRPQPRSRSTPL